MKRKAVIGAFILAVLAVAEVTVVSIGHAASEGTLRSWLVAAYQLLRLVIAGAFAAFVITRGPARRSLRDPVAIGACTAAMLPVVLLAEPARTGSTVHVIAGEAVTLVACGWMLYAVLALGKCFSVLPEARSLVTGGPYRLIRHPVYLGELSAFAGLVIASPIPRNFAAGAVLAAAQATRMRLEERALTAEFPAYALYAASTPRLIPRLRVSVARSVEHGEPA